MRPTRKHVNQFKLLKIFILEIAILYKVVCQNRAVFMAQQQRLCVCLPLVRVKLSLFQFPDIEVWKVEDDSHVEKHWETW